MICFNAELIMIKPDQMSDIGGGRNPSLRPGSGGVARADMAPVGFRNGDGGARQKVERSIAYMEQHVNQPLQVATLAAQANVSPSHFFALFKQLKGCPPMDYFTRLRMRHAREMLDTTSASVKEVAAALGYDDPFYFSRVFKSIHKVPPSRYRSPDRPVRFNLQVFKAGGNL
jgi:transcriptional regulator GlxA family with amidase domain